MNKKLYFFILIITLFILTGCSDNSSNNNQEKLQSEIDYFSSKIINIANDLNNISLNNYEIVSRKVEISKAGEDSEASSSKSSDSSSSVGQSKSGESKSQTSNQSEASSEESVTITGMQSNSILNNTNDEDIDWNNIKNEIELINSSWSVVSIDLKQLNVSDEDISNFSAVLNNCIISIKDENKDLTLTYLSELYSFIPKFLDYTSIDNSQKIIKNTQNEILKAYTTVSLNNWENVQEIITTAENIFLGIFNDLEYIKNREFKINKTHMLIKELKESCSNQDIQLFYLKYKVLLESINTL